MERDLGDILDRWSIAKLKAERIGADESKAEFAAFQPIIEEARKKYHLQAFDDYCNMMVKINSFIWQLEAGLKSGKEKLKNPVYLFDRENDEALANIGKATILIRNFNSLRVDLKNMINKIVGEGFQDIKSSHLSETNGKVRTGQE